MSFVRKREMFFTNQKRMFDRKKNKIIIFGVI